MTKRAIAVVALWIGAAALAGCPHNGVKPNGRPRPGASVKKLARALEVPPDAKAREALQGLVELAKKGNQEARWAALHYLFDLYDYARLTGSRVSRKLLWQRLGLGGLAQRGRAASEKVLQALSSRFMKFTDPGVIPGAAGGRTKRPTMLKGPMAEKPNRPMADGLLALIRSDLAFRRAGASLAKRLKLLKGMRRGPAGYAARLRLYTMCAQAFRVAADNRKGRRVAPAQRPRVLNYCLYPLFDVDPAPHLKKGTTVPNPPWTVYRDGMARLLEQVGQGGWRAAALAGRLAEEDRRFFRWAGKRLPIQLQEQAAKMPRLTRGQPYAWTSAVMLLPDQLIAGGKLITRPKARHYRVALSEAFFAGDQQTQVTVFATKDLPVKRLRVVMERAAATGFYRVGLGGAVAAPSQVGYWSLGRGAAPEQLREVVISLAPVSTAAKALGAKLTSAQLGWDWKCARDHLGVHLGVQRAVPYGPDGSLPAVTSPRSTAEALKRALGQLRDAFPSACAVQISADDALPYWELLGALAQITSVKRPLEHWKWVGYAYAPPRRATSGSTFANRVKIRLGAQVRLQRWPRRLRPKRASLLKAIRPCYLRALDAAPARWGKLEVQSTATKTLVSQLRGTPPEETSLNQCVERAVRGWRGSQGVAGPLTFRVLLKP